MKLSECYTIKSEVTPTLSPLAAVWVKRANRRKAITTANLIAVFLSCCIVVPRWVCCICYYIHRVIGWLILFFIRTVPRCCRLVHQCHWYPWANTKWGQLCSCCLLLFISALICTSVSSTLISCLWCVLYWHYIHSICKFSQCAVCIQLSVLLLPLVTRQQPCEWIKVLEICTDSLIGSHVMIIVVHYLSVVMVQGLK